MQQFGNEVITFIARWLHILWNFSITEIVRLVHNASGGASFLKLLIVVLVVVLIGWIVWYFAHEVALLFSRLVDVVVSLVLLVFCLGAVAWVVNAVWPKVPNIIALH